MIDDVIISPFSALPPWRHRMSEKAYDEMYPSMPWRFSLKRVEALLASEGYRLIRDPNHERVRLITQIHKTAFVLYPDTVFLSSQYEDNRLAHIAAHEIAHIKLGHVRMNAFGTFWYSRHEWQAEATAVMAMALAGVPYTIDSSLDYINVHRHHAAATKADVIEHLNSVGGKLERAAKEIAEVIK